MVRALRWGLPTLRSLGMSAEDTFSILLELLLTMTWILTGIYSHPPPRCGSGSFCLLSEVRLPDPALYLHTGPK